ADISTWMDENPVAHIPYDRGKLGETFGMMAGDGFLWVVESNEGQILKVTPDGAIERVADLSEGHPVPTGISPAPDGGVYVGNLTPTPYTDGAAKVVEVSAVGKVEEVWTGLTMVVGLATGRDGTLYALEMSTGNSTERPFVRPNSGRVVKRTGADALVEVASGLNFPIAMALGPDGALYVSGPSQGSTGPAGYVLRIDPTAEYLSLPPDIFASGRCAGFQAAVAALAAPEATEVAEEDVPTPTPPPVAAGAVPVTIRNFAFDPPTVQIRTGQAVEWTNEDPVAHTATADDKTFDSGNLNTDQSFGYVFDTPGTFPYICIYHPYMKGTIEVTGEAVAGGAEPTEAPAETTEPEAPQATPVGSTGVTVVASSLAAPRGMAWTADGTLYVAQAGTGDTATSTGRAANVVRIDGGCPTAVATGLPSTFDPYKDVMGPQDIAVLDGKLYVVQASTGPLAEMDPATPNGVYEVGSDGKLTLVADLTTWILANETVYVPGDANPRGEPYKLLPGDGFLWVLEANRGEVLKVQLDGTVSRVADLSVGHPVWAGFALAPEGGVYAGMLTGAPHADGTAKIVRVTEDGRVNDVWVNLTVITGIAVGPDGSLYALEMATDNDPVAGLQPGTGKLVVQTGADQAADVVVDLDYPIALRIGPDGAAYIALPAYGGNQEAGAILRVDLAAPRPAAADPAALANARCPGATPYAPPAPKSPARDARPITPVPIASPAASPASGAASGTTTQVTIQNFAFDPATVEIAVGDAVEWTNEDAVAHTATADDKAFDSGNLNTGQTYTHTFEAAGSYDYICSYHPFMKGTVTVR
ncbi:MAG TPA: ScyD/ScyE family protein, partial [Thermomicrobiales bacterium]|nr:ScyD/ScyE family protein [Thermomicrobiales bacterium]